MPRTLFDRIWDDHRVLDFGDGTTLVHVDRIFLHERTGGIALDGLAAAGRRVRHPAHVFCTMDHVVDTVPGRGDATTMPGGSAFIKLLRERARDAGLTLFDIGDPRQGISHVVAADQGIALPGLTQVCPDSHTCTLGGIGALAWGIGSSECEHALATQTLRLRRPRQMRVRFDGCLTSGVEAKDMILHLIGHLGAGGGAGHVIEFSGTAVSASSVESRFTLCNMAVELSAFSALVAPDDSVFEYIAGRPYAPRDASWDAALAYWRTLTTDADAQFDREVTVDASALAPMVTWGTSPQHVAAIDGRVPEPTDDAARRALEYMRLEPGTALEGLPVDAAFIGSCTNARLSDLRAAAAVLAGREVAPGIRAICVPGSTAVKRAAEAEGLDRIFRAAGFEWRESGCSLCFHAGGESFPPGARVISSTNRNFEGRQGRGVRTHLASATTVAASAAAGRIADARKLERSA